MQPGQPALVVAAIQQARCKPHAIGAAVLSRREFLSALPLEAMRQRQHQKLAFGEFQEVIELQMTFALFDVSSPRLPRVSNWHSRP